MADSYRRGGRVILACGVVAAVLGFVGNGVYAATLTLRTGAGPGTNELKVEAILATSQGESVAATQNDITFDPTALSLNAPCEINPEITDELAACEEDPSAAPCKMIISNEQPAGERQRLRVLVLSLANTNPMPDGVLYTCIFSRIVENPVGDVQLGCTNADASDPRGAPVTIPCLVEQSTAGCRVIEGVVSFNAFRVLPARPRVGDDVELQFDVDARVFGVLSTTFRDAGHLFENIERTSTGFTGRAARAGRATIGIEIAYATESVCTDDLGHTFYETGPRRTASADYEVAVAEAATPTPTPSPTRPITDGADSGDGCQIGAVGGSVNSLSGYWLLAVPFLLRRARNRFRHDRNSR